MNELVKLLLSLSLSGTLLIFALFLCKPLYQNRFSRQWQYYIWLVVVARLLLPLTPEVSLVGSLFHSVDTASVQIGVTRQQEPNSPLLPDTNPIEQPPNQGSAKTDESTKLQKPFPQRMFETAVQNIWLICSFVWLMGAAGLLIRKITVYQSFVKYIKAGCVEVSDMRLWEALGKLVEQEGVKTTVGLYTNALISSPLLIGFFHPCIILPSAALSDSDLENTILHELTHYKCRDMFYKWLVQITICLHWFNPFVHFMGKEIGRACEFSCDETVLRKQDFTRQQSYGDTLLNAIKIGGSYNDSIASVTLGENAEQIKERLDAIMGFKRTTRITAAISIALVFALCFGATAAGAYAAVPSEHKAIQSDQQSKINSRVIQEGGVYYILCDGADESNKPTSGVTEGSIMFVLVRKDSYTSISGFTNLEKLVDEVTEQCDYMLKKQSISQEEARLVIQVANKIQSGNDGNLTLVTKEYSMADIKSLHISGVIVKALSENVSITRSGETLKVEYYVQNQNEYTLKNESDAGGTFEELVLRRVTSVTSGDTERPISITIPENINFKVVSATTNSGNINLKNCSGENVISQTQSGDIIISGGFASNIFAVETESGNAIISDFSANEDGIDLQKKSGTITFNGQKYSGNDLKKESGNGVSLETRSVATDAERDAEYDAEYDAWYDDWYGAWYNASYNTGDVSEAEREAYNSVRDIVHKAVLEAHREAHPGVSFENCPECNRFN